MTPRPPLRLDYDPPATERDRPTSAWYWLTVAIAGALLVAGYGFALNYFFSFWTAD